MRSALVNSGYARFYSNIISQQLRSHLGIGTVSTYCTEGKQGDDNSNKNAINKGKQHNRPTKKSKIPNDGQPQKTSTIAEQLTDGVTILQHPGSKEVPHTPKASKAASPLRVQQEKSSKNKGKPEVPGSQAQSQPSRHFPQKDVLKSTSSAPSPPKPIVHEKSTTQQDSQKTSFVEEWSRQLRTKLFPNTNPNDFDDVEEPVVKVDDDMEVPTPRRHYVADSDKQSPYFLGRRRRDSIGEIIDEEDTLSLKDEVDGLSRKIRGNKLQRKPEPSSTSAEKSKSPKLTKSIDEVAEFMSHKFPSMAQLAQETDEGLELLQEELKKSVKDDLTDATKRIRQGRRPKSQDDVSEYGELLPKMRRDVNESEMHNYWTSKALKKHSAKDDGEMVQKARRPMSSVKAKEVLDPELEQRMALVLKEGLMGERLGVFQTLDAGNQVAELSSSNAMFDSVELEHLRLLNQFVPCNQFEEWIQWTRDGKMWRFPIDNDQDSPELNVSFHEHVFLVNQLQKMQFPTSGPVVQFMRLVCVGLSQNPHLTVQEKREHLLWFKEYFANKIEFIEQALLEAKRRVEREEKLRQES